jgi:hypothetical protein
MIEEPRRSLGLALSLTEGQVRLALRDHRLATGLKILELEVDVPEVEFPADLSGGPAKLQHRSTRFRLARLSCDLPWLSSAITSALGEYGIVQEVLIRGEAGAIAIEARLERAGQQQARELIFAALVPSVEGGLEIVIGEQHRIGAISAPPNAVLSEIATALRAASSPLPRPIQLEERPRGLRFDPLPAILWSSFPTAGWKVPAHETARVSAVEIGPQAIEIVLSSGPSGDEPQESDATLRLLARSDVLSHSTRPEVQDDLHRFAVLRAELDSGLGPSALLEHLLLLGTSDPRLFAEAADLAKDAITLVPGATDPHLALAAIAAFSGDQAEARAEMLLASEAFERASRPRARAFALLFAAQWSEAPEAVRMLEVASGLAPDDPEILRVLVSAHAASGNHLGAVGVAGRLAKAARRDEDRLRAHLAAGELLLGPLRDPIRAKREFERALLVSPKDVRASHGLATALIEHGDRRRAVAILEPLIDRAAAEGDLARAADLSVRLGDLWGSVDSEAATLRYRRALELDPNHTGAVTRLAAIAPAGRAGAEALEAIELLFVSARTNGLQLSAEKLLELHLHAGRIAGAIPGRETEAARHLEAACSLDPLAVEPLEALIEIDRRRGALRTELLGRAAELWRRRGDLARATRAAVEEARLLFEAGRPLGEARRTLEDIIAGDHGNREAVEALIELSELAKDPGALAFAIEARLRLEAPDQLRAQLLAKRSEALAAMGERRTALEGFEAALALVPGEPRALSGLISLLRSANDHETLAASLERAAAKATGTTRSTLLSDRARALADAGREAESYAAARAILDETPEATELLPLATSLAIALGDLDGARHFLARRRASLEPNAGPEERLELALESARLEEKTNDAEARIAALSEAIELAKEAGLEDERGRPIMDQLAELLNAQQRYLALAKLERRRADWSSARPGEAAGRALVAARLFARSGEDAAAQDSLQIVLERAPLAVKGGELIKEAMDLSDEIARRSGDPLRLADHLLRRSRAAERPGDRIALRLEECEVLVKAGLVEAAADRLERAQIELLCALPIVERLAEIAKKLGRLGVAARAIAQAAALVEELGDPERAIALHASAAEAFEELGQLDRAQLHDRAVIDRSPDPKSPRAIGSLRRLERSARASGNDAMIAEVLDRWSRIEEPPVALERLLERAAIQSDLLGDLEGALATMRRATAIAGESEPVAGNIATRCAELLEKLGRLEELAALLEDRATRQSDPKRAAELKLDAAQVLDRSGSKRAALTRASAALRADPNLEPARLLRRKLLRELGLGAELAEALVEDAALASADERLGLSLDAAEALAPLVHCQEGSDAMPSKTDIARALAIAAEIARSEPKVPAVHRRVATYARLIGRVEDEFLALGQLIDCADDAAERLVAQLRRVDLLRGPLEDAVGGQAELSAMVARLEELPEAELSRFEEQLERASHLALEDDPRGVIASVLRLGVSITEQSQDWTTHLQYLSRLMARTEQPRARADLLFRMGDVTEWKLGDGNGAERQYLAALAIEPTHAASVEALTSLYLTVDRYGDLAENLGIGRLQRIWKLLKESAPPQRIIAAGEALWPRLEPGSRERAEVLLTLGDLYRTARDEAEGAVMVLEHVIREGPPELEGAALERLRVLFLEEERYDLYVEILRRQAERAEDDRARARALAELGEALEWKLGDGAGAEREYRSALAADSECESAKERLALLLTSQDRFAELANDLGRDALSKEVRTLAERVPRERDRFWRAATALADVSAVDDRASFWLALAEKLADAEDHERALHKAADEKGEAADRAKEKLAEKRRDEAPKLHPVESTPEPAPAPAPEPAEPLGREKKLEPGWRQTIVTRRMADRTAIADAARAAGLARRMLDRNPLDRPLIEALISALLGQGDRRAAAGPGEVLRARWPEADVTAPPLPQLPLEGSVSGVWRAVASDVLAHPLGALLAVTARAMAAILPPGPAGERRPLPQDAPIAPWLSQIAAALELEVSVELDKEGRGARGEPGEPPVLVVGEALLSGDLAVARWTIARALMALRLGTLVIDQPAAGSSWMDLPLRVVEVDGAERLDPSMSAAIEPLRTRLGPTVLADVEGFVERIGPRIGPESVESWRTATDKAADAYGVLAAGALGPMIGKQADDARWRAPEVQAVLRFLLGMGYLRYVAALPSTSGPPIRHL